MSKTLRQLGYGEARMSALHRGALGTTQLLVSVSVAGPLDVERLRAAVERVERRHDILRVRIGFGATAPVFIADERATRPERVRVLDAVAPAEWLQQLERLNARTLHEDDGLWCLYVLPSSTGNHSHLLLAAHHSILDGAGVDNLLHQILSELTQERGAPSPAGAVRPLLPAAEQLMRSKATWQEYKERQRSLATTLAPDEVYPHVRSCPMDQRQTRTLTLEVAAARVDALVNAGARRRISLNSLIASGLLGAAAEHSPARKMLALYAAFSLRGFCGAELSHDDLGSYISVVPTLHEARGKGALLELAQEHQAALVRSVLIGSRHPSDYDFGEIEQQVELVRNRAAFQQDLGFTFIESRLQAAYGGLRVSDFYATVNRRLGSLALVLHGVRHATSVYLTLNYTEPVQDAQWVSAVAASLEQRLSMPA